VIQFPEPPATAEVDLNCVIALLNGLLVMVAGLLSAKGEVYLNGTEKLYPGTTFSTMKD
jgi:hypothetical protein